jgi:hypothetical protein
VCVACGWRGWCGDFPRCGSVLEALEDLRIYPVQIDNREWALPSTRRSVLAHYFISRY